MLRKEDATKKCMNKNQKRVSRISSEDGLGKLLKDEYSSASPFALNETDARF